MCSCCLLEEKFFGSLLRCSREISAHFLYKSNPCINCTKVTEASHRAGLVYERFIPVPIFYLLLLLLIPPRCGRSEMSSTTIPTICKDLDGDDRWLSVHKRFVQECKEKDPDVMFIGDCILESLQFTDFWNSHFVPMHCLNFSIRNDRIQNVLWRLQNGELDNVKPKVVVLHVGTNNISDSADEVAEGVLEVAKTIRNKLPDVYVVIPVSTGNLGE